MKARRAWIALWVALCSVLLAGEGQKRPPGYDALKNRIRRLEGLTAELEKAWRTKERSAPELKTLEADVAKLTGPLAAEVEVALGELRQADARLARLYPPDHFSREVLLEHIAFFDKAQRGVLCAELRHLHVEPVARVLQLRAIETELAEARRTWGEQGPRVKSLSQRLGKLAKALYPQVEAKLEQLRAADAELAKAGKPADPQRKALAEQIAVLRKALFGTLWRLGATAGTPRAVILAMARAIESGDGEAFARCFDAPEDIKAVLKAIAPFGSKMAAFTRAGVTAYGKEAWQAAARGPFGPMPSVEEIQKQLKVKVEGDTATATLPTEKEPLKLVKKGGVWLIKPPLPIPADKELRDTMVRFMKRMPDSLDPLMKKIGQPGTTAEMILAEAQKAMEATLSADVPEAP